MRVMASVVTLIFNSIVSWEWHSASIKQGAYAGKCSRRFFFHAIFTHPEDQWFSFLCTDNFIQIISSNDVSGRHCYFKSYIKKDSLIGGDKKIRGRQASPYFQMHITDCMSGQHLHKLDLVEIRYRQYDRFHIAYQQDSLDR
jgi:hypothetical protein